MNYIKLMISCTFVGLLLSLSGCAKKSHYKPNHVRSLKESTHVDYQETKEQVTVRAKALNENDCDIVFGERADRVISGKNPLQPIQLCIENNSTSTWKLLDSNIGLSMVPTKEVVNRLSSSNSFKTAGICCGIGILAALIGTSLAFVCLPCLIPAVHATSIGCIYTLLGGVGLVSAGGLLVVASPFVFLIDNYGPGTEHKEIRTCISQTKMGKALVINPGKTIDVLLFVREQEFKQQFNLTLITKDEKPNKLPFFINLRQ